MAVPHDATAGGIDFLTACATAASEVVDTIPGCDLDAAVPACPGWTAYDLVRHLGNTHGWAATVVETRAAADKQDDAPPSTRPRAVARWYAAKAEDLLAVLREAPVEADCWTFSAQHHQVGFWSRRQTHETLVHLADLRQTMGRTSTIHPVLAADGVAEVLEVFLPRMHARGRPADLRAPLLLHATDTRDSWVVSPGGPPRTRRVAGEEVDDRWDLVTAPAADLMLLLWRRLPPDHPSVVVGGDVERVRGFLRSPLTA